MPEDLEAIAVRIERLPRLGVLWIDATDADAAHLRLGRDIVDQRGHFVLVGHEAAHHAEQRAVLLHLAAQVLHGAARQILLRSIDDGLEAVDLA
jgi:hypothetical protein